MSDLAQPQNLAPTLPARSLPELLRSQIAGASGGGVCSLLIATVAANPDSQHVTVTINGVDSDVGRLASYSGPVVGEPCYVLLADGVALAIGSVR